MAEKSAKSERLEARVSSSVKRDIERAAALTGRSLTDFVLQTVEKAAQETIREHEIMKLTSGQSRLFVQALLNPPTPNAILKAAFEHHLKLVKSVWPSIAANRFPEAMTERRSLAAKPGLTSICEPRQDKRWNAKLQPFL